MSAKEFGSELSGQGFELSEHPGAQTLMGRMDPTYLREQGRENFLELTKDLNPEQIDSIVDTLNNHLDRHRDGPQAQELVQDGLRDIAFPTSITQGGKQNCGAVALQQVWAHERPESYIDALTRMSEGYSYDFGNGQRIQPLNDAKHDKSDTRSLSVKVMSDALAQYAHKRTPWRDLAATAKNKFVLESVVPGFDTYHPTDQQYGLHFPQEILPVLEDITGDRFRWGVKKDWDEINGARDEGDFVPTLISASHGSAMHWVNLIPGESQDGQVKISSWGREYEDSESHLDSYVRLALIRE